MCKALKVKVASLNSIRLSIGSHWSCLRSSSEENVVRILLLTDMLRVETETGEG